MDINIEEIMQEIRQEIADKGLTPDMLSFEDVPYQKAEPVSSGSLNSEEARNAMVYLNSHFNLQPYKPLAGNPVAVFVKKVIRKLVKFYIEPLAEEQSNFNANTVRMLNAMQETIRQQDARIELLRQENAALRSRLKEKR